MAKIYIDPGHNPTGNDTGAVGYGLKEQDVSVQVGIILRELLLVSGQTVKMSRENITDTVSSSLNGSLAGRYCLITCRFEPVLLFGEQVVQVSVKRHAH